jgi:hypothetical protein
MLYTLELLGYPSAALVVQRHGCPTHSTSGDIQRSSETSRSALDISLPPSLVILHVRPLIKQSGVGCLETADIPRGRRMSQLMGHPDCVPDIPGIDYPTFNLKCINRGKQPTL